MTGTLLNTGSVLLGGILGLYFGGRLSKSMQESLIKAAGTSVLFLSIAGSMSQMLSVRGHQLVSIGGMLLILCVTLGTIIGEGINIEKGFEDFGQWLKKISKNEGDPQFIDGFLTASLTICIGAMAIIGSIEDGLTGDYSILAAKSVLDGLVIFILSASKGKGVVFSALPLFLFQGSINRLAFFLAPLITEQALANLSLVGNVLIFCVGLNLVFGKMVKVGNMLPALVLAVLASVFM